ncbi:acetyl esterase [Citrobacter amalonaticus]|nr:acetyl esterase [Citrobacter amalonaticus]
MTGIMRLLASYTQCTVIGVDYSLSPEARFPQAIEETIAACQFFYQQADDYQLNMTHIGFAGDSAGAMLSLASALWLRDKHIFCGKVAGRAVVVWTVRLTGLSKSTTDGRRLGRSQPSGFGNVRKMYLRDADDRESPYYCLFNNDLTRDVPPCFIAGAEFDR